MSGAAVASIVNDFLNTGISLFNTGYGVYQDQRNSKFSQEQFDYQKALNQQIMDREDTALQRRVADAEAAGINKYAVAGQGASASNLSTFGGSMGSQTVKGDKLDFAGHLLQIEEQEARTQMAKEELAFFRDTKSIRKQGLENDNAEVAARTRGIDIDNLMNGAKNSYYAGTDGSYANLRSQLAAELLGLQYSNEGQRLTNVGFGKKNTGLDLDNIAKRTENAMKFLQHRKLRNEVNLDSLRYQWLTNMDYSGQYPLYRDLWADLLGKEWSATKNKKDSDATEFKLAVQAAGQLFRAFVLGGM